MKGPGGCRPALATTRSTEQSVVPSRPTSPPWCYALEREEPSVAEARDRFSQRVNEAAFGDETTYVTRGRTHERVAAIVPIELLGAYDEVLDRR